MYDKTCVCERESVDDVGTLVCEHMSVDGVGGYTCVSGWIGGCVG